MKFKKLPVISAVFILFAAGAQADAEMATDFGKFSAVLGVVSDYRYRGISRSENQPSVQAGLDWWNAKGFYAGVRGSSVDFHDHEANGETANGYEEIVPYAGYRFAVDGIKLNVGAQYYTYPGEFSSEHYEYLEYKLVASHNFGPVDINAGFYVSPRYYDSKGPSLYSTVGFTAPIRAVENLSATGSFGHTAVQKVNDDGFREWSDWSLGLAYKWEGFKFTGQYIDTSVTQAVCGAACAATGVFGVSRTF